MDKYRTYDLTDFVKDPHFRSWANGENMESNALWNHFIQNNPEKKDTIIQAQALLRSLEMEYSDSAPSEESIENMFGKIQDQIQIPVHKISAGWWIRIGTAASLLLLLGWVVFYRSSSGASLHPEKKVAIRANDSQLKTKSNPGNNPFLFNLPDGSTVLLQPGSVIQYDKDFNEKPTREVTLNGEAFFNVTRNPERPFLVLANSITTKVLGTSFWVRSFDTDKEVSVAVKTGKVTVFTNEIDQNQQEPGIMLTPNQKISYNRNTERLVRSIVAEPMVLSPSVAPILDFTDVPVTQVLSTIQQTYGIEIEYDSRVMQNCLLTASFTNESLFEKISLICKAVEAEYTCNNGKLTISGDGCP